MNKPTRESPWEAVDKLEVLSEQPTKPSRATEDETAPIIEPKTKGKNSEVVGQPLEQPNTELLIVKTIQGLTTCINNELEKLSPSNLTTYTTEVGKKRLLIADAIEEISLFEKTTLLELQKAFK